MTLEERVAALERSVGDVQVLRNEQVIFRAMADGCNQLGERLLQRLNKVQGSKKSRGQRAFEEFQKHFGESFEALLKIAVETGNAKDIGKPPRSWAKLDDATKKTWELIAHAAK